MSAEEHVNRGSYTNPQLPAHHPDRSIHTLDSSERRKKQTRNLTWAQAFLAGELVLYNKRNFSFIFFSFENCSLPDC